MIINLLSTVGNLLAVLLLGSVAFILLVGLINFVYEVPKQLKRIAEAMEKRGDAHDT